MNRKSFLHLTIVAVIGAFSLIAGSETYTGEATSSKVTAYYTCPMHPQVHQDGPGKCPICHMDLVKVDPSSSVNPSGDSESRAAVHPSERQLDIAGVQKLKVEQKSLTLRIPFTGRFISSSSIAFQIYENDLRYVRSGISFKGKSSLSSSELQGSITSVDSIIDPTSRTVRVVGQIKNSTESVRTDSSFFGQVQVELKDRLSIPEEAVIHTGQEDLVYLVKESKVIPTAVALGAKAERHYEVLKGLNEGDTILSGPNFLIDSEAKIRGTND